MSIRACVVAAAVLTLSSLVPGKAHSGLFDFLSRPWHIEQPMLCRTRLDIMAGDQDWIYWQSLLPIDNRAAGLRLHQKHTNNSVSFWAELDPAVEVEILRQGTAPYVVEQKVLSDTQKNEIVVRVTHQRKRLVKTEQNLKKLALVAIPVLIGYAGAPAVAAIVAKDRLKAAISRATIPALATDILSPDDLTPEDIMAPANVKTARVTPDQIGQFFYKDTRLARTFSILTTEGPHKWLVTQLIIFGRDLQGEDVVIPVYECLVPMKWRLPE